MVVRNGSIFRHPSFALNCRSARFATIGLRWGGATFFAALALGVLAGHAVAQVSTQGPISEAEPRRSASPCVPPTTAEVAVNFEVWRSMLALQHPDRLLRLYAATAEVESPLAASPLKSRASQRAFWVEMLARAPRIDLISRTITPTCTVAIDRGQYRVTALADHRVAQEISYTLSYAMTYALIDGRWLIVKDVTVLAADKTERPPLLIGQVARPPAIAGFLQRLPDGLPRGTTRAQTIWVPTPTAGADQAPRQRPMVQRAKAIGELEASRPPSNPAPAVGNKVPVGPKSRPEVPRNESRAPGPRSRQVVGQQVKGLPVLPAASAARQPRKAVQTAGPAFVELAATRWTPWLQTAQLR